LSDSLVHSTALMGTVVTVQVVGHGANHREVVARREAIDRALGWFRELEERCSRFDEESELRRLSAHIGEAVPASAMLFEAVRFALAVARETDGAFDPTLGLEMEARGFNREHRTGAVVRTALAPEADVSFRDVRLDPETRSITLLRPLLLDLGAVAKGLAIDMAARELEPFGNFAVDAGGDLYLGGSNADGERWSVGIRHPREEGALIETLRVSNTAVCTSGDYERRASGAEGDHHILDPRSGESASAVASATVLGPSAMVADALATAAFVLGPADGIALLERHGVEGLLVTPSLERFATRGMPAGHSRDPAAAAAQ